MSHPCTSHPSSITYVKDMRDSGGVGRWHAVQQVLAAEAAAAVRQGADLARRRGHPKVTPVHVAGAMLSGGGAGGLLIRDACLWGGRSRRLQCEALELCFTEALDSLPAGAGGVPDRGGAEKAPAVSNALAAAVRRAKTLLQRRCGSMPELDVKVGVEQLVVSILDDPTVSRVMSKAGFSSYQVKADVEKAMRMNQPVAMEVDSKNSPDNNNSNHLAKLTESTGKADGDDDAMSLLKLNHRIRKKQCTVSKAELKYQIMLSNGGASTLLHDSIEGQNSQAKPRTSILIGCNTAAGDSKPYSTAATASIQPWQRLIHSHEIMPNHLYRSHANPNRLEPITLYKSPSEKADKLAVRLQPKFTELTAENLKVLCGTLEMGAEQHKDIVPDIAITVLLCRSGVARRRGKPSSSATTTSVLFQGSDSDSKKAVAKELAKLVFGTSSLVELTVKREEGRSPYNELGFLERLYEVVRENPRRVIMIHNIEDMDRSSKISVKNAIAEGRIRGCNGAEVFLEDAIVVLTCETIHYSKLGAWMDHKLISHGSKRKEENVLSEGEAMKVPCFSLDLNACAEEFTK